MMVSPGCLVFGSPAQPMMRPGSAPTYAPRVGEAFARATKFSRKIATIYRQIRRQEGAFESAPLNFICAVFAAVFTFCLASLATHSILILRSRALARRLEGWPRAPTFAGILRGSPLRGEHLRM